MKAVDEKGKVFGRINILDLIALVVVAFFAFVLFLNLSHQSLNSIGTIEETVQGKIITSVVMEPGYFNVIKPGMKISEDKRFMDLFVTDVVVRPFKITTVDASGKTFEQTDPTQMEAIITLEGKFIKKGAAYKLGKQEVRQGIKLFVEGELFNYQSVVIGLEVKK